MEARLAPIFCPRRRNLQHMRIRAPDAGSVSHRHLLQVHASTPTSECSRLQAPAEPTKLLLGVVGFMDIMHCIRAWHCACRRRQQSSSIHAPPLPHHHSASPHTSKPSRPLAEHAAHSSQPAVKHSLQEKLRVCKAGGRVWARRKGRTRSAGVVRHDISQARRTYRGYKYGFWGSAPGLASTHCT